MQEKYDEYRNDSAPCKSPGISNQFAVRMSLALVRNGFSLDVFPNQRRVHRGRDACALGDEAHLVGADELHRSTLSEFGTQVGGAKAATIGNS